MDVQITTLGALLGLAVAIILIIKKVHPAYSLILGAVVGGLVGGAGLTGTVDVMMSGAKDIMPAILRIITSGVLAGVLIQTGAAAKIADQIIKTLGEKRALFALALSTMILTGVGVFVDVAVITVAPIALAIAKKLGYPGWNAFKEAYLKELEYLEKISENVESITLNGNEDILTQLSKIVTKELPDKDKE